MNILVTGGAGLIGSHLSEILVEQGHNVVVIDNLFLGTLDNLNKIKGKIDFYNHEYEDKYFLSWVVREHSIEYVFHLAGLSSSPMFDWNESIGSCVNIIGFINLLEVCRDENIKRLMYASSSSIYGESEFQAEDVKVEPPNFYAFTKYAMEHAARIFYDTYQVQSIGFRFFSVYGRNERHKKQYANLISQFLWAMEDGKDIAIYGDGNQTRDFTYVLDICNALIKGMESDIGCDIFNIGTSESYTLNAMVDILEQETGLHANRVYIKNPVKNYVNDTKADTTKIYNELGFKASYSLRDGIKDLL